MRRELTHNWEQKPTEQKRLQENLAKTAHKVCHNFKIQMAHHLKEREIVMKGKALSGNKQKLAGELSDLCCLLKTLLVTQ